MKFNIVSLFSGCGGLDLGFELTEKFRVVWANDLYRPSAETFSGRFGLKITQDPKATEGSFFTGDVEQVDFSSLCSKEIDVVTGGPPCQDFSLIRGSEKRKGIGVKRGRLYVHFVRALVALQPKMFVFENVKGLTSVNGGLAFRKIVEDFENLNLSWREMWKNHRKSVETAKNNNGQESYKLLFSSVANFSKLGAPQQRERIIIIGIRKDMAKKFDLLGLEQKISEELLGPNLLCSFPITPIEVFSGKTLDQLEEDYKELMREYGDISEKISSIRSNQYFPNVWSKYRLEIWHDYLFVNGLSTSINEKIKEDVMKKHEEVLKESGYWKKPVNDLVLEDNTHQILNEKEAIKKRMGFIPPGENHEFVRGTSHEVTGLMSNIYRRIHPLKPSPTIIARGGGGTWGYHYRRDRQKLTNRERARIQTFPDDFLFKGSPSEVRRQIGEAVPPLASKTIALLVKDTLNRCK